MMFEKRDKIFIDDDYRSKAFLEVFNNPKGEEVMAWLEHTFKVTTPNFDQPNEVYFKLGKQAALNYIKTVVINATKGE